MTETFTESTMRQFCPTCDKLVDARLVVGRDDGGYHTSDVSTCLTCGRTLYSWKLQRDAPVAAAKPVRIAGRQLEMF